MRNGLPLVDLGLLQLLERIERGTQVIDALIRHGLVNQGLILAGVTLELSDEGRRTIAALRARREELATQHIDDTRQATEEHRRECDLNPAVDIASG